jgi:isopenicillin N synthase-like dioxygenase
VPDERVDATNAEFLAYEQVDKDQRYRLAEREAAEAFDEGFVVRTCDLSGWLHGDADAQRRFAEELGAALGEIGFAILERTGIDAALYDEAEARVLDLFTRLTLDEKLRFAAQRHGSVNQGYFPIKATSGMHPDLVEGWVFCRRAFASDPSPFWPSPEDAAFFHRLCAAHDALVLPIMQAMLLALGQDPHVFDVRMRGTNFGLRLNYYPPLTDEDDRSGAGRLLGHEDVTMFTMLPAPRIEGLQVLDRRSMKWVRLHAPPGPIVLNTGDYMQRISNDRFPSTTHRVSKPRDPALRKQPRATFPFNVYLNEDEVLEVLPGLGEPKYPPVKAITFHTRTTAKHYGNDYAVE